MARQTRVRDVIMGMQHELVQEEIANEYVLVIPEGPLTRARPNELKKVVIGMLKHIWEQEECLGRVTNQDAIIIAEFSPTS